MAAAHQQHFYGHIEKEVKRWLVTLLLDPEKFHPNTRELTGRIMSTLAWDDATQGKGHGDSAIVTLTQMSVSGPIVNTVTPIWHIADFFRHNPWREFEVKRESEQRAWWLALFRVCKARYLKGDLPSDSWTYRYFEQLVKEGNATLEQTEKEEDLAACMLGFQCLVGVVTISGPMQFFLMAMALHPEWTKKCQEELDRVCGDRMPTTADSPNLPTVRACLKETLRWRSGVPLGE
jgi:cytochrome P450